LRPANWTEIGEHLASSQDTWHQFGKLITFFGPDKLLTEITSDDLAQLVAWRRGQPGRRGLLSSFTVNAMIKALKKLFTRAKLWGVRFEHEPRWRDHWQKEPEERVRELVGDEAERLEAATRPDYLPIFRLVQATGLRLNECFLRWSEVDFAGRQIRKRGKGNRLVTRPITATVHAILWPLQGHHPEFVFTFISTQPATVACAASAIRSRIRDSKAIGAICASALVWRISDTTTTGMTSPPSCCARPAT
jgi:integrase